MNPACLGDPAGPSLGSATRPDPAVLAQGDFDLTQVLPGRLTVSHGNTVGTAKSGEGSRADAVQAERAVQELAARLQELEKYSAKR